MVTEDTYEDNEDVKFKTEALAAATSPEAKLDCPDLLFLT